MRCQKCQENEATVHYTQVINGQKSEVHLCDQCADQEGYMNFTNNGLSIHQFLTSMFPFDQAVSHKQTVQPNSSLKCEHCGLTYQDFRNKGKFGCSHCYEAFESYLDPILKRVHSGNVLHVGKIPKRAGGNLHKQRELEQLKDELQQLIQQEAFEEAAQVRDKIKQLREDIEQEKGGDV
ncbi:UvrB/UvrC motif-containing protein [Bacillaceae bacterium W0354]